MSFDRLARHYRWMEFVLAGEKLQRCRTRWLGKVEGARSVLIFGEGNGRFLAECARQLPKARILVVDQSAGMLREAKARLERSGGDLLRVDFEAGDALKWRCEKKFDVVVTNFFLDCFAEDQLERIVENLTGAAEDQASWLLSDFQIPESGWKRWRAAAIHRAMYLFFGTVTGISARRVISPDRFLERAGFVLKERDQSDWGLLRADFWRRG